MKINIGKYLKKGVNRKIDIKIEPFDTYSMDNTLALIILPMLLQLKATKQGVPQEFAEVGGEDYHAQDCFEFYKEDQREMFDKRVKDWDTVLDKMIWSFQQIALEDYSQQYQDQFGNVLRLYFAQIDNFTQAIAVPLSGTTANRPESTVQIPLAIGQFYYDTTIDRPIWWNGTVWKKADGTTV